MSEITIDDILMRDLTRYIELKPLAKEYEKLSKKLGEVFRGTEHIKIGKFIVTGHWEEKSAYSVRASRIWKKEITVDQG